MSKVLGSKSWFGKLREGIQEERVRVCSAKVLLFKANDNYYKLLKKNLRAPVDKKKRDAASSAKF